MITLEKIRFTSTEDESGTQGGRTIIDGMNYTFEKGKFYTITGPNGSGKTTLAKLMMGIFPLTSGKLVLDGEDISGFSITERSKKGIAYSFQHPARFKGMTFRQLLTIAAGTDDENQLVEILARVGICSLDYLEKDVDAKLSGGEIKKIELATTIARNPKVAIYDEPDTGIDLWTIGPMVDLIKRECRDQGTTTIVISHNKAFLEAADQLLLIKAGEIAYDGDYSGVKPILEDLSVCEFTQTCEGEGNAGCYR
ncbi:putative ABC transporter, ATP-binding protein [Desulfosarcina variabilis str. Montpellier]|uniref:ATP-binding cassette domain-containing protein n=1 Tax=Desulfosarcina variabilis TaxID=2300 RepID=UPI003AFA0F98